jgi:hypothetical protein
MQRRGSRNPACRLGSPPVLPAVTSRARVRNPANDRHGHDEDVGNEAEGPVCNRCGRPVIRNRDRYEVFERMPWACFHYEFEHENGAGDPDVACGDLSRPARAFDPTLRRTGSSREMALQRSVPPIPGAHRSE